jgi:hypothetical protein
MTAKHRPRPIPAAALRRFRAANVFNPWSDVDPLDLAPDAPLARLRRLEAHFTIAPAMMLIGEASGYQGCHFSGIPFTSERLIAGGSIPRVVSPARLSRRSGPWSEPSATTVWGTLHALGLADQVVLWNAFAWHPHRPGEPYSNRAPTAGELEAGRPVLEAVIALFRHTPLIAVGKVAERALAQLGHAPLATLRHPSMGGATLFRQGLLGVARTLKAARAPRRR